MDPTSKPSTSAGAPPPLPESDKDELKPEAADKAADDASVHDAPVSDTPSAVGAEVKHDTPAPMPHPVAPPPVPHVDMPDTEKHDPTPPAPSVEPKVEHDKPVVHDEPKATPDHHSPDVTAPKPPVDHTEPDKVVLPHHDDKPEHKPEPAPHEPEHAPKETLVHVNEHPAPAEPVPAPVAPPVAHDKPVDTMPKAETVTSPPVTPLIVPPKPDAAPAPAGLEIPKADAPAPAPEVPATPVSPPSTLPNDVPITGAVNAPAPVSPVAVDAVSPQKEESSHPAHHGGHKKDHGSHVILITALVLALLAFVVGVLLFLSSRCIGPDLGSITPWASCEVADDPSVLQDEPLVPDQGIPPVVDEDAESTEPTP